MSDSTLSLPKLASAPTYVNVDSPGAPWQAERVNGAPATRRASTLHDVAAVVGVSPRTVSRVVNDQGGFSEATRTRVLEAVETLNYRPNAMARALITRRSGTVAFIAPGLNDPFFPEVAEGVQNAALDANLTMFIALNDHDVQLEHDVLSRLEAYAPDGVIVYPAGGDARHLRTHLDGGLRMVVIDAPIDHPNAACVLADLRTGTTRAVEHLLSRGRRRLAMIASTKSPEERRRREPGFLDALPPDVEPIVEHVVPNMAGGRAAMRRILERAPDVDGLFAYNDVTAIGAMEELRASGRSVPDDVAVVGCDDIEMGSVVTPALTTIRIERERLGHEAVRALRCLVDDEPIDSPVVLPVELVVRDSA